jgi:pyridoxine 5-phosphate synthase
MTKLSVNVNKVATLRNTRAIGIPSVIHASRLCLEAGAHGITVHPRPDHRHIKPDDVVELTALLKDFPKAEFNIEGNPLIDYMAIVERALPTQCTFVPDSVDAFTSNQGYDLKNRDTFDRVKPLVAQAKSFGCRVSLFMDPDPSQVELAKKIGADRVELYTEPYASGFAKGDLNAVRSYAETARAAESLGLGVNAGHDLNLKNLPYFLEHVPQTAEVSIGHALIADALEFGLDKTVRKYLVACGFDLSATRGRTTATRGRNR